MKNIFRKISIFLIIMLIVGMCLPQASAATWTGSGTASSPYLIADESGLRQLATNVNNGNSYSGKYFKLTADIALTQAWTPIGTSSTAFCGTFDGNGMTISGMTVTGSHAGLFAYIGSGATIKNVILTDYSVTGTSYLAGLAAHADAGTGSITITGCSVSGTLTDTEDVYNDGYLGGIVAYADAESGTITISDCTSAGSIICDDESGGIVGYGKGTARSLKILNCTNRAYIGAGSNSNACGGIAGYITSAELVNCMNYGSVSGNGYSEDNGSSWLGGIAGSGGGNVFTGCANYGGVTTFFAGGISPSQSSNTVNSCLNVGDLSHSSDGYGSALIYSGSAVNSYYLAGTGSGITGAASASAAEMASGAVAHALREYFGQEIGVDAYPVPLTATNRVYKVTVVGEATGTFYVNYGDTVALPELSSCAAYFDGDAKFDPTTPITRDYALAAKGYHNYVDGVCTYCGNEGVNYVDVGTCGDSVAWTLTEDGVLTISGSGAMADYSAGNPAPWNQYASTILTVTIDEGVTVIGDYAFKGLANVTTVNFADTVTTIGSYAFNGMTGLTTVAIGDNVTAIGEYAFGSCTNLSTLNLNSRLETIGDYAFYQCGSLQRVVIPASVNTLGNGAFRGCTALSYCWIYSGLETIGSYALAETAVPGLQLPATVEKIGDYAFANCSALTEVTFLGAAPEIAATAFSGDTAACYTHGYDSSWKSVVNQNYGGTLTWAMGGGVCNGSINWVLDFDGTLTIYGTGAMYNFSASTNPGWYSLREKVLTVVIEDGVTSIGNYAFYGCCNMTSISIADSVTQIGSSATSTSYSCSFLDCTSLTQITIPKNCTVVAYSAFMGCTSLTSIDVASGNTAYSSADGVLYDRYKYELRCYPAGKTGTFTIPSGVDEIAPYAFSYCNGLTDVTIPSAVTYIGTNAFYKCGGLSHITFEGSAPTIGSYAFTGVTATVDYPSTDTTWTTTVMRSGGGTLTWNAGSGSCGTGVQWALTYVNGSAALKISGSGAMSDYTTSTLPWAAHIANIKTLEVCDGVTYVGACALNGATSLTTVTLADSVTSIGTSAFDGCTSLRTITWSSNLQTIGDYAFSGTKMYTIDFPDSLRTIGRYAFYNCTSLTSLTFGDSMQSIGYTCFAGCTALQTVDLGSSITTLDQSAFNGCSKLTKIVIPASVTSIGTYAFRNCTNLQYVEFLGNAPTFNTNAFGGTTCNAYYLSSKSGWTSSKLANYGGTITWGALSQRGTCGSGAEWLLDANGNLYICGSGSMKAYSETSRAPWYDYRSSIKTVTVRGVTSIGAYAFADCTKLQVVIFEGNAPSFGSNCFSGVTCEAWHLSTASSWTTSKKQNYGGTLTWRSVTSKGNFSTNAKWALDSAGTLVVLGTGAMPTYYSSSSNQPWYSSRASITSVVIGGEITSVGNYTFWNCSAMKTVTIGDSVTSIGTYAFWNCTAIETVTIGKNVTSIGSYAFTGSSALTTITFKGNAPTIGTYAFNGVTATAQYPLANTTWTTSKKQNYGGTLTWEAVCMTHSEVIMTAVEPTCTETGLTEGKYCSLCSEVLVAQEVIPANGHYAIGPDGTEVPADTIEPDCLTAIICTVCNEVAKEAPGHRVLGNVPVEADPLTITNHTRYPWTLTNGTYYSTNKAHDSLSSLTINVLHDCTLTLICGVSSEEDYDELEIYYNGSEEYAISGEVDDYSVTLTLKAGDKVVIYYDKDEDTNKGSNKGWVTLVYDNVMVDGIGDVPAETAEPDCTNGVVCRYCETVVKEPAGHRVIVQQSVPEVPYEEVIGTGYRFALTDGVYYSSNVGVGSSICEKQLKVTSDCTMTLNYGVSSETTYDKLTILLNGTTQNTISGVVTNQTLTLEVTTGDVVTVRYSKDGSVNKNEDRGWFSVSYEIKIVEEIVPADTLEADCTNGVVCSYCETVVKEALGHSWSDWETVTAASCHVEGEQRRACSACSETETKAIPVVDHSYTAVVTEPTCENGGYTTHTCSVCGYSYVDGETAALGHSYGHWTVVTPATCTEKGEEKRECACGETETRSVDATGHTAVTDPAIAPGCTTPGVTEGSHCSDCGEVIVAQEPVPAKGHTEEIVPGKAATCTEAGLTDGVKCSACGETVTAQEEIPAKGHTEEVVPGKAATCTEAGLTEGSKCSICGEVLVAQEEIPVASHTEETIPGKAATCTEAGLTEGSKCSACGEVLVAQEEIPVASHTEETIPGKAATCTEAGLTDGVKCSVCGEVLVAQETVAANGHSYVDGTCTVCGAADPDAEPEVVYTFGQNAQIRLIEPWGLKANAKVSANGTVVDYDSLYDYGVYFIRESALDREGLTQATITVEDIINDPDAVKYTKDDNVTVSGSYMSAIYDKGLYTYEFSDSVFVMFYIVTEEGADPIYVPIRERNLSELINARKDDTSGSYTAKEKAVYSYMAQLEKDILEYRAGFENPGVSDPQKAPKLSEYALNGTIVETGYTFGQNVQIRLIEPWGMRLNAKVSSNGAVIDYTAVKEYGIIAVADANAEEYTQAQILASENAYVFSSKNGDVTIRNGYISADYTKDILTYQLDTNVFVMAYVIDADDNIHFGPIRVRNLYELMSERAVSTSTSYSDQEKKVYADMVGLYNTVTEYRKDFE